MRSETLVVMSNSLELVFQENAACFKFKIGSRLISKTYPSLTS